jgi:hypothetical protein
VCEEIERQRILDRKKCRVFFFFFKKKEELARRKRREGSSYIREVGWRREKRSGHIRAWPTV